MECLCKVKKGVMITERSKKVYKKDAKSLIASKVQAVSR